jgi:hypothetical protein
MRRKTVLVKVPPPKKIWETKDSALNACLSLLRRIDWYWYTVQIVGKITAVRIGQIQLFNVKLILHVVHLLCNGSFKTCSICTNVTWNVLSTLPTSVTNEELYKLNLRQIIKVNLRYKYMLTVAKGPLKTSRYISCKRQYVRCSLTIRAIFQTLSSHALWQ